MLSVDDFDLQIDVPVVIGVVGKNGAGKSTLLKMIAGILLPTTGKILVTNLSYSRSYQCWAKENTAYIQSGDRGLRLKNTVKDNIIYYGLLKGTSQRKIFDNIDKYSPLMGIENLLERRCESLSTGEKKKVQIMCGICSGVKVLILDEPSNGLDISSVKELRNIIHYIKNKQNKTVIISSHDMSFLKNLAAKYIYVREGKVDIFEEHEIEKIYNERA